MARCNECNGVITRTDSECYICGLPLGEKKAFWNWKKKEPKPAPPVTPVSNLLFVASLVLTLVSFMAGEKMSSTVSATLSVALLIARIFSDRVAARQALTLRPITITRLHY